MDNLKPEDRKRAMAAVRGEGTSVEIVVRRILQGFRFRFETNCDDLPGRPDLVLRRRRKIIFVHGCFWHLHQCNPAKRSPKTNSFYWQTKRIRNEKRDARA